MASIELTDHKIYKMFRGQEELLLDPRKSNARETKDNRKSYVGKQYSDKIVKIKKFYHFVVYSNSIEHWFSWFSKLTNTTHYLG